MLNSILSYKLILRFCSICFAVGEDSIAVLGIPVTENKDWDRTLRGWLAWELSESRNR